MTKEGIIELIRREVSAGTLTVDDVLVEMDRVVVENIKTAIEKSQGKISFIENKPRLISCCFSQVLELDVNEVWYNNGLHFSKKHAKYLIIINRFKLKYVYST